VLSATFTIFTKDVDELRPSGLELGIQVRNKGELIGARPNDFDDLVA